MEDKGETVVAIIVSTIAAAGSAILGVLVSRLLGQILFRLGLMTDEGAAWSGISLGAPVGLVCALIALVHSFRKIRAYGKPE